MGPTVVTVLCDNGPNSKTLRGWVGQGSTSALTGAQRSHAVVRDLAGTRKFDEQKETETDMWLKLIVLSWVPPDERRSAYLQRKSKSNRVSRAHAHVTLAELPNITNQPCRAEPITSAAILPPALTLSLSTTMVDHHFLKNVHFSSQGSDPLPKTPTASDLLSGSYNPAKLHPMASL